MTRKEVKEIVEIVTNALNSVESGCRIDVVGGYRRGKELNNDVDILIASPTSSTDHTLQSLIQKLKSTNNITEILSVTNASNNIQASKERTTNIVDASSKCLCAFIVAPNRIHRRVDLVVASKPQHAFALLGWTGYISANQLW